MARCEGNGNENTRDALPILRRRGGPTRENLGEMRLMDSVFEVRARRRYLGGVSQSRRRIVIIEDDESVRALLHRALHENYEVETVAEGTTAVERLQGDPVPDLVICDVMLPGVDGFTIARQAKASKWAKVPIIFLTARTTPRDVIEGIQSGARHYLTKPFKLKDLQDKVAKILGR